jgi:ferredoxin
MVIVSLQRKKCIGCNYCVEYAPNNFAMSGKDGKAVLLRSEEKKGFHTHKSFEDHLYDDLKGAQDNCPAKIIKVKKQ